MELNNKINIMKVGNQLICYRTYDKNIVKGGVYKISGYNKHHNGNQILITQNDHSYYFYTKGTSNHVWQYFSKNSISDVRKMKMKTIK